MCLSDGDCFHFEVCSFFPSTVHSVSLALFKACVIALHSVHTVSSLGTKGEVKCLPVCGVLDCLQHMCMTDEGRVGDRPIAGPEKFK